MAAGIGDAKIDVFSACPHASSKKAMAFIGLGRDSIITVPCLAESEAMDVSALKSLLAASNSPGKVVIASAGTVTGTDFDDLQQIAQLCKEYQAWLHVDAAFGLFSRLLTDQLSLTAGIEHADSITCDGHKWLNVPYDCGMFFTKHPETLQQVCSVSAPYLDISNALPAYMDRSIENSRRFRALPGWLTLKAYGLEGYRNIITDNCDQATALANWLEQSADYELLTPCRLNVVVFKPNNRQRDIKKFLTSLNQSGQVYLTPGMWNGQQAIRVAFSNWRTSMQDVEIVCQLLAEKAAE
ncbi:MAG: aminotransferase class I/II-fold pyridoxal phosphate-dependent enzyme [Pseudomonadales bacterium]|nr:aminotransferase class I/II-fold pyridoxal phosphate-dependent enzyme [Pseudomonadales bacterium]